MFNLEEELKNLPELPGVYIMHGENDEIIYVGKAKILKNRVRQYFQKSQNHSKKVLAMVSNIKYFEYIVTDSEIEALVLECNLIKKHKPKYNILLKDDKHYPYIKVTINEDYPKIFMTRTLKKDGAKYFGPYGGMQTVDKTLEIVQKIFKPPLCTRKFPADIGKGRPCLNYHINNCFAPCIEGHVTRDEYRKAFFDICAFLEGNHEKLLGELTASMEKAADEMEFETAAALRDKIEAIRQFEKKQKAIDTHQGNSDIISVYKNAGKAFCEIFFVRMGKMSGRTSFRFDDTEESENEILTDFIKQFYMEDRDIPKEILTEYEIWDKETIEAWLTKRATKKVSLITPKRGVKKELIVMAHKNAEIAAENHRINNLKIAESKNKVVAELAKKAGLLKVPHRIESYDISNISGEHNVGAMVVFADGRPSKKDYRHFKIKSFEGADDYMAMREVIYRRFRHAVEEEKAIAEGTLKQEDAKFLPRPDLILLDGGKGHLSAVLEIMEAIDCDIPVFGMIKDKKHRTRGLLGKNGEVELSPIGNVFKFITRVQDEVHNNAISYHKKLRNKSLERSELDNIKGVGKARKQALMKHFGSVENIKSASLDELLEVLDKHTAATVFDYFRKK